MPTVPVIKVEPMSKLHTPDLLIFMEFIEV